MKKFTFMRRRFAVFRCAQNVVDDVGFLEWYFLVWPNRPDLLARITGLVHSMQEYRVLLVCVLLILQMWKTLLHSGMPLDPGVFHCVVPHFGWLNMLFHKWNTQKP